MGNGEFKGSIPFVAFVGWHNSGKTTVVRGLARELRARGYAVAVMKSTKHSSLDLDRPGTDSNNYYEEDGVPVAVAGPFGTVMFDTYRDEPLIPLGHRLFPWADIIVCEGFKSVSNIPKIEVRRSGLDSKPVGARETVAVVSDLPVEGVRRFEMDDVTALADFVEDAFLRPNQGEDMVSLLISSGRIPLNNFVRNALKETVLGFARSLKGGKGLSGLTLFIRKKRG